MTPVNGHLWIAPPDLLGSQLPDRSQQNDEATFELAGNQLQLPIDPIQVIDGLAVFELNLEEPIATDRWPIQRLRHPRRPENVAIVIAAGQQHLPIDVARITASEPNHWAIGASLAATEDWHGASVVSREDGNLIGLVIFEEGHSWICPLSEQLIASVSE